MPTIFDLTRILDQIAPLELAEPWDNVGLLLGNAGRDLDGPVVLTIDLTEPVLAEAIAARAGAIIAYHPPLFEPVKRLAADTPRGRIVLGAIEAGIAVYSPHTALDATDGGVTDWLCEGLSGSGKEGHIDGDSRALIPHIRRDEHQQVKLVTFVPQASVEEVRNALASAGAGIIGNYKLCSFAIPGTGTFFGEEGADPAVGEAGQLEYVNEIRLEMVCSKAALPLAIETLARFHPYEEPPIDVYELLGIPDRHGGPGRRLVLDQPATLAQLAERLKKFLNIQVVNIADVAATQTQPGAPGHEPRTVTRVGICPGSGASLAKAARADGCEVFVTGEMKHHEVLDSLNSGMSVILAGHTNTERGYLPRLARRVEELLPGVQTIVSKCDRSPSVPA